MDPSVGYLAQLREFVKANARTIFILGFVLLLLQDVFGTHGVVAMRRSQKEASQIRQEIQQLNDENKQLDERVKDLKSDPQTIEEIARKDVGLARPGEYIFKVTPPPSGDSTRNPNSPDPSPAPAKQSP
ncbi:MAG: septum formation initiator family protein [Candidatus Acidiferrales bacterium]